MSDSVQHPVPCTDVSIQARLHDTRFDGVLIFEQQVLLSLMACHVGMNESRTQMNTYVAVLTTGTPSS